MTTGVNQICILPLAFAPFEDRPLALSSKAM